MTDHPIPPTSNRCPSCGHLIGERHECAQRLDTGETIRSHTTIALPDCGRKVTLTLDMTVLDRVKQARRPHA